MIDFPSLKYLMVVIKWMHYKGIITGSAQPMKSFLLYN